MAKSVDNSDFLDGLLAEMTTSIVSTETMGIVEFAHNVLYNDEKDFLLYPTQKAILKTFYKEPLTQEEQVILNDWLSEERTTWVKNRRYISLVLEAGRRSGKCLAASSIIPTTVGDISCGHLCRRLNNKERIGIKTYDFSKNIITSAITYDLKAELNAIEPVYKLTTYSGKVEVVNLDHPFKVYRHSDKDISWVKLKDLHVGDLIATSGKLDLWGTKTLTENEIDLYTLIICSYLQSNGEYRTSPYISITKIKEILDKEYRDKYKLNHLTKTPAVNYIYPKEDLKLLFEEGINIIGCLNKESSINLLNCINKLRGRAKINKSGAPRYFFNLTKQAKQPIFNLLTKLGCNPYLSLNTLKGTEDLFLANKKDIAQLSEYISIDLEVLERLAKASNKEILEFSSPGNICPACFDSKKVSREQRLTLKSRVRKLATEKNNVRAYDMATNEVNWEVIKSIEHIGTEQTIALEVKDTSVIGSYIISHNSTLASIIALKEFYDLITLANPQKTWGLLPAAPISILVMAQSKAQVKETIFAAIRGTAEQSTFFSGLKNAGAIDILSEEIRCPAKNVAIYGKHSNSKSLVGYNLKCMLLDEVARFETTGEAGKNKAVEIWRNVSCHKEDNLIYTDTGATTFKELLVKPQPILTYNLKTGAQYHTDKYKVFDNGYQPVYRITTKTGRTTEITAEHPLLIWNPTDTKAKWVEQKDLKIGDVVALSTNNIAFSDRHIRNPNLAKVCGYLISNLPKLDTKIPNYIFKASKEETISFIAAFYTDEYLDKCRVEHPLNITSASTNIKVLQQMQELLLRFDILSTIKATGIKYHLTISENKSLVNFYQQIIKDEYNRQSTLDADIYLEILYINLPSNVQRHILNLNKNRVNIVWDYIDKIESIGNHSTIGLSVKDTNIIGNSFISHNTGGAAFGSSFKKIAISSAWEPGDPMEVFYQDAYKDPSTLGFKLTTFQVNLALQKGVTPLVISDYATDYVKARREYEGVRFSKFNTFIDLENLEKAATGVSVIDASPCKIDIKTEVGTRYYAGINLIRIAPLENLNHLQFVHIDPALKKDSAAMAIAHAEQIDNKWKIVVDSLLKWEPHTDDEGLKRIVSYIDIEQKLEDIHSVRPLHRVTFDQYNSESFIQKLHGKGIDSAQVSCSREMQFTYYTLFRDLLAHGYIILPRDSLWSNNAITELSEMVLKSNRQIIHPFSGKDLGDAIVNVVYQVHQYMIRSGFNITTGLSTTIIQSNTLQGITNLQQNKSINIGSARDKLYNIKRY